MCGIVGMAGKTPGSEKLARAVDTLRHRGPDDTGLYISDGNVALGHTRLSILDPSPAGHQPMSVDNEDVVIAYNGEVYNFQVLRAELEAQGVRFRSRSDTEVILRLYRAEGFGAIPRLNGIFALAIFDRRKRRLLLARDHLGVKPLYYAERNGTLVFASEIKAILSLDVVERRVDWQAIYDYFSFLFVPCPRTAFEGIAQLPPGHQLSFDLDSGQISITPYWRPHASTDIGSSAAEQREQLRTLLDEVVRMQLVSDVPLGVFLSGGVDSGVLTALASRHASERLKTFTVVFEGEGIKPYDERAAAARVSRHLGTEHSEVAVRVTQPEEMLDQARFFDQPFANPTFYLNHLISESTRRHVKVALSGAGGDELFGGYPRYRALPFAPALAHLPRGLGTALRRLLAYLPEDPDQPVRRRLKLMMRGVGHPLGEQYLRWTYFFSDDDKRRLLRPLAGRLSEPLHSVRLIDEILEAHRDMPVVNRIEQVDLATFLLDNILEYTDKTSMAASLEARVPYLDHRLVEFSLALPARQKIRGNAAKRILRDSFGDLLPAEVFNRPKQGFCPPISEWITTHFSYYFDLLTPSYLREQGVLDHSEVQRLRAEHLARRRDNSMELFAIVMFDVWYRKYIA